MSTFVVNGQTVTAEKNKKLLRFLRDDLGLTSVKDGCSEGACGACTVIIDGVTCKACVPDTDKLEGRNIITVEGLSDWEKELYTFCYGEAGAVQCGFCIPGMIISAKALLDYGFAAYRAAPVPLPQERPLQLKVKGSTEETVPLDYAALPATALLPAESAGQLTVQLELPDTLEAPVTRGQTVGKAQLLCGEAVQGEYPVCAAADAPRMDFDTALQLLWDSLRGTAA